MRLPDFVGVGALKAGTTFLDGLLRSHPALCLPPGVKEVQFFTRHFDRGIDWYASHFDGCGPERCGEVSPQYLADPRCPGRIRAAVPDVRLLVNVRHPVARTYSQYKHWVQVENYRHGFDAFIDEHPNAVERSLYWRQLEWFLQEFPADRIQVIVFEDLVRDPTKVMQGVYDFLDVDATHLADVSFAPENSSIRPKHHRAYVTAKGVSRWLYDRGGGRVVALAKRSGIGDLFGTDEQGFAPLPTSTAERLSSLYTDDVAKLSAYLGRDLSQDWSLG